jgi:hypothetical protein
MAGLSFYIGFVRPPRVLAWLSKAGFIIWLFLLSPILGYVLYQQSGSIDRLESTGFVAHPDIEESVGIANGVGENPIWLFKINSDGTDILEYYRSPDSRPGWEMSGGNEMVLMFKRERQRMAVAVRKGWSDSSLMFSLSEEQNTGHRTQDAE